MDGSDPRASTEGLDNVDRKYIACEAVPPRLCEQVARRVHLPLAFVA